jgi:hypothetical protein
MRNLDNTDANYQACVPVNLARTRNLRCAQVSSDGLAIVPNWAVVVRASIDKVSYHRNMMYMGGATEYALSRA